MTAWRHIRIHRLAWFCNEAPLHLRWRLEKNPAANKLQITLPRGLVLDLKVNGGFWIRRQATHTH